jgi:hypothetical protein
LLALGEADSEGWVAVIVRGSVEFVKDDDLRPGDGKRVESRKGISMKKKKAVLFDGFPDRLARCLATEGLSLQEVETKAGLYPGYLRKAAKTGGGAQGTMRKDFLLKLAKVCRKTPEWLATGISLEMMRISSTYGKIPSEKAVAGGRMGAEEPVPVAPTATSPAPEARVVRPMAFQHSTGAFEAHRKDILRHLHGAALALLDAGCTDAVRKVIVLCGDMDAQGFGGRWKSVGPAQLNANAMYGKIAPKSDADPESVPQEKA